MKAWLGIGGLSVLGGSAAALAGVSLGVIPLAPLQEMFSPTPIEKPAAVERSVSEPQTSAHKPQALAALDGEPNKLDAEPNKQESIQNGPSSPPKEKTAVDVPVFDIMRVEKDGSLLVAGRTKPNSTVELMLSDGSLLGKTKASPSGEFVILPEEALKIGDHALILRSSDENGDVLTSKQTGIVQIPEQGGEILALIDEEGKASRIVIKPALVSEIAKAPKDKDKQTQVASLDFQPSSVEEKFKEQKELPVATALTVQPDAQLPFVTVEAVEVEGRELYIAGAVPADAWVRIYIDNTAVGTVKGTADDRFLLSVQHELTVGKHLVRADVINRQTGDVLSRAEVPLIHDGPQGQKQTAQADINSNIAPIAKPQEKKEDAPTQSAALETLEDKLPVEKSPTAAKTKTAEAKAALAKAALAEDEQAQTDGTKSTEPLRTGRALIVKKGDSLWRISRRNYGRGLRYLTIYNANKDQIRDPNRIYIGQIFKIPQQADEETAVR